MALLEFTVGEAMAATLRPWVEGDHPEPAAPRPAATVLLVRAATVGETPSLEVFLLRRRASMAFAARMHVFPGGGIDPRDAEADPPWSGPTPAQWAEHLQCEVTTATAIVCAAVRELFEECGVLLAGPASADAGRSPGLVSDVSGPEWEAERTSLLDRSQSLSDLLHRRGLVLRSDLLRPWAHWLTPEFEPRRYDTWFFLAALPVEQQARHIAEEADATMWAELGRTLHANQAGELAMMLPTVASVREVQAAVRAAGPGADPVEAVLDTPRTLRRVMPWPAAAADGSLRLLVDLDGRGGGRTREAVSGSWP